MVMNARRFTWAWVAVTCLAITASLPAFVQKDDKDEDSRRPKLILRADPNVGLSPVRARLTAELVGGANDYEDYYCPQIEWDWGDGTRSQSTFDCAPYQPGKSEIRRRFIVEHLFRAGQYHITFRLKRTGKTFATVTTDVQVQSGLNDTAGFGEPSRGGRGPGGR